MKTLAVFALSLCPLSAGARDPEQPYARSARAAQHHDTGPPSPRTDMFQEFGGSPGADACRAGAWRGEVMLRYDALAGRWIYGRRAAHHGLAYLCVAIAGSADAGGSFHRYVFELRQAGGATARSACQEMASWPDAYYFSHVMHDLQTGAYLGPQLCAYGREAMLAGQIAEGRCVDAGPSFGPWLPAEMPAKLWLIWRYAFATHTITTPVIARAGAVRTCTSG